jgi:hypothetical protein
MKIHMQIEQIDRLIEDAKSANQHANTPEEREKAIETLKALKAKRFQLERLEKRFSPNQLKALEAMNEL